MIRAVLDTNALVSARLRPDGNSGEILKLAAAGAFVLVLSGPILAELRDVLRRPRIQKRLGPHPKHAVREYLSAVYATGHMARDLPDVRLVEDDPEDNHVVAAALAGEADYLVSGDQHLLSLVAVGEIRCVAPAAFLAIMREGLKK